MMIGACARNMQSDSAEIKPAQCCIKLVFHLTYTMMHGSTKLKFTSAGCSYQKDKQVKSGKLPQKKGDTNLRTFTCYTLQYSNGNCAMLTSETPISFQTILKKKVQVFRPTGRDHCSCAPRWARDRFVIGCMSSRPEIQITKHEKLQDGTS